MGRDKKAAASPERTDDLLGYLDWICRDQELWPLYTRWLTHLRTWHWLCRSSLGKVPLGGVALPGRGEKKGNQRVFDEGKLLIFKHDFPTRGPTLDKIGKELAEVATELSEKSPSEQTTFFVGLLQKHGLEVSILDVVNRFNHFCQWYPDSKFIPAPQFKPLVDASPFCSSSAIRKYIISRSFLARACHLYPSKFYSPAEVIGLGQAFCDTGEQFAGCKTEKLTADELEKMARESGFKVVGNAKGRTFSNSRQVWHNAQRDHLGRAVQAILESSGVAGPRKLAKFVMVLVVELWELRDHQLGCAVLGILESLSKGGLCMPEWFVVSLVIKLWKLRDGLWDSKMCDLKRHFNRDRREKIVRQKLGLKNKPLDKAAKAWLRILYTVVFNEELLSNLLVLADDALMPQKGRRKGRRYLQERLEAIFDHIGYRPSNSEEMRNFIRNDYAAMRNTTPEQRKKMLGLSQDNKVRDLNQKEKYSLFEKFHSLHAGRFPRPEKLSKIDTRKDWSSAESLFLHACEDVEKELSIQK